MNRPTPALRALAHASVVWLCLAAIALLMGALTSGTTFRADLLPAHERHSLVAREIAMLAFPVFGFAGSLALLAYAFGARPLGKARRRAGWIGIWLAAIAPMLFYGSSWTAFRSTGRFLDSAGLIFMATDPVQFFQHAAHINPGMLVTAPLLVAAAVVFLVWGVAAGLRRLGRVPLAIISAMAALGVAACTALAARGLSDDFPLDLFVTDPDAGMVYTYLDLYADCRDERAGPMARAWADIDQHLLRSEAPLRADPAIAVVRRPIISMEDFVAGTDASRIRRWNVILVIVESLRPDQLAVMGGPRRVMPNVERLAGEGLAFPDHYTQASHSNYADICPLSSHYPLRSARVHLYPENPTYPRVPIYDVLHALGWHTAVISSQNEAWGRMINYLQTDGLDHFFDSESFEGPTYVPRNDTGFENFLKGSKRSGKIDDRFTVDEAMRWIGSLDDGSPFFIYMNLQNSHLPYETPADFPRRFGPAQLPFTIEFGGFPRDRIQTVKDVYADSLAYSDHQLGRLVRFLKERGEWQRTVVVVTGDTGQAFYEHGFVAHANRIYDELMRVPLVIRAPGITARVDPRPAQHIDVAPTLLDLLDIPPHPSFQGVSLVADDPDPGHSRFLMVRAPLAHQYGVVRSGFKLVHDVERDKTTLVNLRRDPGERRDVSARNPRIAEELRRRVETWRAHQLDYYADPKLHTKTYPPVLLD